MNFYRWAAVVLGGYLLFMLLVVLLSGGLSFSFVPGIHTPVLSPIASGVLITYIWIIVLLTVYLVLNKRQPLKPKYVAIHISSTLLFHTVLWIDQCNPLLIKLGWLTPFFIFWLIQLSFIMYLILSLVKKQAKYLR